MLMRGAWGFSVFAVLAIFKIGFRFLCQKNSVFSVLVFIAVCGFSVF